MRPLLLLAASTLALTTAACGPKTPVARAALDCPLNQGDLTRTSASADGKTCTYATSSGAEVTLQLVSTQGGVDNALTAIETTLLAGRAEPAKDTADAKDIKGAKSETATVNADASTAADKAIQEAKADAKDSGVDINISDDADAVHVAMKDGKVVAKESHDGTTTVNLPGIHVVANDRDDTASVRVGPIHIDAGGDGKMGFHMRRDVRLRGEALNPDRRGMRATFIYTGEDLPNGYRFVGYEAGGPKTGPITVAVVKSKSDGPNGGELYPDVKKLVRKNGGV